MIQASDRQRRLEAAIAEYLTAVDSGQVVDAETWIDRYPDLSSELSEFLTDQASFDRIVQPLRSAVMSAVDKTVDAAPSSSPAGAPEADAYPAADCTFGDYTIVREIGRGGMGVVFEAYQASLDRRVALKMLRPGALTTDQTLPWLSKEAQVAAALDHPAIVPIFEVGEHRSVAYYAMKLVRGGTLVTQWRRYHDDPSQAVGILLKLAEAVDHAHRRGVLHRDLKPANVLIDSQGKPHITDFGLARRLQFDVEPSDAIAIVGTPSYMAPEQTRGDQSVVTIATDVYGLGAILYSVLTGQPPFRGDSVLGTIELVRRQPPQPPSQFNAAVSHDLSAICLKCLEKNPRDRYPTARSLTADLQRYLDGEPVEARPVTKLERWRRWCRRNPMVAGLSIAVTALLLAAVLVASWAAVRFERLAGQRQQALKEKTESLAQVTTAQRLATERLYESLFAQARAGRLSGRIGRRFESLEAIRQAAGLARELQLDEDQLRALRNEAIACIPLLDLQPEREWPGHPPISEQIRVAFDANLERYARLEPTDAEPDVSTDDFVPGDIVVRRMADNRELHRFPGLGHMNRRPYLCFSPDGQMLAALGLQNSRCRVVVWKLTSGEEILNERSRCEWYATSIDFSADSRLVGMVDAQSVLSLHDVVDRSVQKPFPTQTFAGVRSLRFAPDGRRLAVTNGRILEILDCSTGVAEQPYQYAGTIIDVTWSPDGSLLGVASGSQVSVIELPTRKVRQMAGSHNSAALHVCFNQRGNMLASTGWDFTTRFWDPNTGAELLQSGQYGIAFSADDQRLAWGTAGSSVGRWQVFSNEGLTVLNAPLQAASRTSLNPNGRLLASATSSGVRLWDVSAREEVGVLDVRASLFITFNAAGDALWTSTSGGFLRWPIQIDEECVSVGLPQRLPPMADCRLAAISRDERWVIAVESDDGKSRPGAFLRPTDSTGNGVLLSHPGCVRAAFSPDGKWIATAGRRGKVVKIWETETAGLVTRLAIPTTADIRFSPNGRWLATGGQHESVLWDIGTWKAAVRIPRTQPGEVGAVAFDGQSRLLAVLGQLHTIRLIALNTGAHVATLEAAQSRPIYSLSFTKDGNRLLAAPRRGRVQIWDLAQIRRRLATIGLDWSHEPLPPEPQIAARPLPLELQRDDGPFTRSYERGMQMAAAQRWSEAADALTHAIEAQPESHEAIAERGKAYVSLQAWDRAIADFARATTLEPDNAGYWHNRGAARLQKAYTADLDPDRTATRLMIGQAKLHLGDSEEALKEFQLCAADPAYIQLAWEAQALAYLDLGDYARAAESATRALKSVPQSLAAYRYRALAHVYLGNQNEAIADADLAVASEAELKALPAWILEREVKAWTTAIAAHPDSAAAHFVRAALNARMHRWDASLADVRRAVELHHGLPTVLGECLPLNLDPYVNYVIQEPFVLEPDFAPLDRKLGGIPFRIGERQIKPGLHRPPQTVGGIAVNRAVAKIHFLTNAHYYTRKGVRIGEYRVHYADGNTERVPVVFGENVSHWSQLRLAEGPVAWVGTSEYYRERCRWVHLRRLTWTNPYPEKRVREIDVVSSGEDSVPYCAAITVELPAE